MNAEEKKFVKVRVNAAGRRLIGIVVFDWLYPRLSDFLNSIEPFLVLRQEQGGQAVQKDCINYLEALEEHPLPRAAVAGAFEPVELELCEPGVGLTGELFFPEGSALADLLSDERRFLSLRNVVFAHSVEKYGYLAVGKRAIAVIRSRRL